MNPRTLIAVVVGLVLVAFGGFYFALKPARQRRRSCRRALPPAQTATPVQRRRAGAVARRRRPPPPMATPASIEAEIARSEHAELQALLKKNFADEYNELIAVAVRRRNEGVSDQVFGQELAERFQDDHARQIEIRRRRQHCRRSTSSPPTRRACFMRSAPKARRFCLKMLGKDDSAGRHGAARKRAATDAARHAVPVPGHRRGHAGGKAGRGADDRRRCGRSRPRSRAKG